jgi:predicted SnoaL-like aldol condensation-catalyzing enzyme
VVRPTVAPLRISRAGVVELRSIDIWRVEDAMFVEHWDELNLLEMLQQMGAIPPLGTGPA